MRGARVLITGGAGFIGSHTAWELVRAGYRVRLLDALCPPVHAEDGDWPTWLPAEAERVRGDVRERADWERALDGVDYVIHLAAYQDLLPAFARFFHVNAVGTALLYEVIVERKLPVRKVVVASSQFVYGEGRYRCPTDGEVFPPGRDPARLARGQWDPVCPRCGGAIEPLPLLESHADPKNQYSISKYSQELMALALGRNFGIPSVALRYSIVQGPWQSFRNAYSGVLRVFTLSLLAGRPAPIFEDGAQLRDYVHVADVARANRLVLESEAANGQVFNVGGGRGYTVREFAQMVVEEVGWRGPGPGYDVTGEYRVGDTRHSVSDISRLRALGWEPTRTPRESVREYVAWLRCERVERDYAAEALRRLRESGALRKAGR